MLKVTLEDGRNIIFPSKKKVRSLKAMMIRRITKD